MLAQKGEGQYFFFVFGNAAFHNLCRFEKMAFEYFLRFGGFAVIGNDNVCYVFAVFEPAHHTVFAVQAVALNFQLFFDKQHRNAKLLGKLACGLCLVLYKINEVLRKGSLCNNARLVAYGVARAHKIKSYGFKR